MAWSWRRSTSLGPIRLNFSRSGIGISAGVRGARISTGPRGTYVHVGAGGFRYSQRLDERPRLSRGLSRPDAITPTGTSATRGQLVEVVEPGQMIASSPDELIEEIRSRAGKMSMVPALCVAGTLLVAMGILGLFLEPQKQAIFGLLLGGGLTAFLILPWVVWWDKRSLITRIYYNFDPLGSNVHEALVRLVETILKANKVWSIRVEDIHGDWKRNAGAGVSVHRSSIRVGWGPPPGIVTNVQVGHLVISDTKLYLFPDRLLIYGSSGIQSIRYTDLTLETDTVNFIEDGDLPGDAIRVGTTWKFVNRNGGPDLRFNDNRQLAIMQYGVLNLWSSAGLRLKLHLSTAGLAAGSAELLGVVQNAIKDLKLRGEPLGLDTGHLRTEDLDLPPLVAPALNAARIGAAALEYRWLKSFPEWAVPIIWGLVFALPAVAGIFIVARGQSFGTWSFMGLAILISGCGIPVLARDYHRLRAGKVEEETQDRKNRFSEMLKEEFRSKAPGQVDIESLALECEVSQEEVDSVADELFRRMSARAVRDEFISPEERRILRLLATALRMTTDRRKRLEAEGVLASYRQDVSNALADGTLALEESQILEEMRTRLGYSEFG